MKPTGVVVAIVALGLQTSGDASRDGRSTGAASRKSPLCLPGRGPAAAGRGHRQLRCPAAAGRHCGVRGDPQGADEELAAAWNQRDEAAIAELLAQPDDAPETPILASPLFEQVQALTMPETRRIRLADDVELFWFLRSDAVKVRQPFRILTSDMSADSAEASFFEASLMRGARGWRFVSLFVPPKDKRILRVGDEIKEPRKIRDVPPVYPDIAKQARVQGVVILEATLSPDGVVTWVKVVRGIPLLDQAAVDAVQKWRYTPTLLNRWPYLSS